MSRIGNRKIEVPEGVTVKVENDIEQLLVQKEACLKKC